MKKIAIVTFVFLGLSFTGFSQEQKETQPERIKLVPVEKETNIESPADEIERLQAHLEALDAKESWIRSNPDEMEKANESGWFEQAAKTRREINIRLTELNKK